MSAAGQSHYSIDLYENDDGWWIAVCNCGWGGAPYPTAEDACDALMQHAYEQGWIDAKREEKPPEAAA